MTLFAVAVLMFVSHSDAATPTLPVARWTEVPNLTYEDDFILTLSAEHISGIDRVEFTLDDRQPVVVREKTPHPQTGYPEYLFPVGRLNDGVHVVSATVHANNGGVLDLKGDPMQVGDLNARNSGINSFYFRSGDLPVVTVGVGKDFENLDEMFEVMDPVGHRVLVSGDFVGVSKDWGRNRYEHSTNPILIEGVDGARMTGLFGGISARSLVFKNIEFAVPMGSGGGTRIFGGDRRTNNIIAWVGCTFAPDSQDPDCWKDLGWVRYTSMTFYGGIFSIGNTYHKVNKGPDRVTLSKGDSFTYLTWDCLSANPGAAINLTVDRGSTRCDNHGKHADIIQYWGAADESVYGPTRNRLFVDWVVTNFYGQVGHLEGTRRLLEDGTKEPSNYKDWYFARWSVDGHDGQSMNFYCYQATNFTFEDLTMRNIAMEIYGGMRYPGLIARNVISYKWKSLESPSNFWVPEIVGDGYFENWWVENSGNRGYELTGYGPVDFANPEPPIVESPTGCIEYPGYGSVEFSDPELIDLSNTIFESAPCYESRDLTYLLAAFGKAGTVWDLDGDGVVGARDLGLLLESMCI